MDDDGLLWDQAVDLRCWLMRGWWTQLIPIVNSTSTNLNVTNVTCIQSNDTVKTCKHITTSSIHAMHRICQGITRARLVLRLDPPRT